MSDPETPAPGAAPPLEPADTDPAPAPEFNVGGAGTGFVMVKGGTTTSAWDKRREQLRHQTELGRQHQDKQERASALGGGYTPEGFVKSKLHSLKLLDGGNPRLVLNYLDRDGTVRQECISEVFEANGDIGFTLVCRRCLERGEPQGLCQLKVMQSHRHFDIDSTKLGKIAELVNPFARTEEERFIHVKLVGTVTCRDIIRCGSYNCAWAVRVTDSNVSEV